MSHTKQSARTHLHDGAVLEYRPRGQNTFWRRGIVRELPEGRWAIEMVGPGTRAPMDGRHEYRSVNGSPLHILTDRPWWAATQAVA